VVAVFLLLSQLRKTEEAAPQSRTAGLAVLVFGLLVGAIGNLAHVPDVIVYGFVVFLTGLLLVVVGLRSGVKLWAPVVYLVFMVPLPNFLYWQLSTKLQLLSSQIGTWLISAFGVPVYLDGNIIDLGVYQLQVAEACSGLNYLFPLASFGFLFAVLYQGPAWQKVVLFLSSIPITVFMNCLRIAVIGLLVDRYGIEQAEGFLHAFEGWVIFVTCLVLLFAEAWLLQRLTRRPRRLTQMLDLSTDGFLYQARRLALGVLSKQFAVAALMVAAIGFAWQFLPTSTTASPKRESLALYPLELGDWRGKTDSLDANISRILAADDYLLVDYRSTTADAPVNFFVAFYSSQIAGSGIHSPEVCIPGGGWEVSRWETRATSFSLPSGEALRVNRAIVQKGLQRQLVYYWFEERGRPMTGEFAAKIATLWDSVIRGRTDGALVRLVTPIAQGEAVERADERLSKFLELSYPPMSRFIPS
jgi:exosortase D (VPLPA-CTERM-specific)